MGRGGIFSRMEGGLAPAAPRLGLDRGDVAAASGIHRLAARSQRRPPVRLQLLRAAETVVGRAGINQLLAVFPVEGKALGLPVGAVRATDVGAFVPIQAQPAQLAD